MDPNIYQHYQRLAKKYDFKGPYLEVGAAPGGKAIMAGRAFSGKPDRKAINLDVHPQEDGIEFIQCNSNDMRGTFADASFNTIFSNAVLEHDKYFWLSLAEMKRVLAPGGHLVIGAPAFVRHDAEKAPISGFDEADQATITYKIHCMPDYWRFSPMAFRQVICEGLDILELKSVRVLPRLIAVAQKPLPHLQQSE